MAEDPQAFTWGAVIEISYAVGLCPLNIAPLQPEPDRFKGKLAVVAGRRPGKEPEFYPGDRQGTKLTPEGEVDLFKFVRQLVMAVCADRICGLSEEEVEVLNLLSRPG
ncbi:MAG: hypothetical protein AB1374_07620 [Bacillota bacterium]